MDAELTRAALNDFFQKLFPPKLSALVLSHGRSKPALYDSPMSHATLTYAVPAKDACALD
ncbi:MAG TPA: hypothetical protein VIJ43_03685 [Burkholderiales bacterium]